MDIQKSIEPSFSYQNDCFKSPISKGANINSNVFRSGNKNIFEYNAANVLSTTNKKANTILQEVAPYK